MNTNPLVELLEFLRRMHRDSENGWVFGVCAGLADFFNVNVAGVRLLVAVLAWFLTLPVMIVYIVLAVLMRDRPLVYRGGSDERRFWSRRADRDMGAQGDAGEQS